MDLQFTEYDQTSMTKEMISRLSIVRGCWVSPQKITQKREKSKKMTKRLKNSWSMKTKMTISRLTDWEEEEDFTMV